MSTNGVNVRAEFKIGQEIEAVNPVSGQLETGTITAYTHDFTQAFGYKRGATGLMVKFGKQRPVEVDGDFL